MSDSTDKEQTAKKILEIILAQIKACIARGEKPSNSLIEQADKILENHPSAEITALFKSIISAQKDAINAYEYKQNTSNSKESFDELLKSNPILAIKLFIEARKDDIDVAIMLSEGLSVPLEKFKLAYENALDPEKQTELNKVVQAGVEKLEEMRQKGEIGAEYHQTERNMEDIAHLGLAEMTYRKYYQQNERAQKSTTAEAIHAEHGESIRRDVHQAKQSLNQYLGNITGLNYLFGHPKGQEALNKVIDDPKNYIHLHEVGSILEQRKREVMANIAAKIAQQTKEVVEDTSKTIESKNKANNKYAALKAKRKKIIDNSSAPKSPTPPPFGTRNRSKIPTR